MEGKDLDRNVWMTTKRIETLVDGIFAIAMTLLVLSINVPQLIYPVTNALILQSLDDLVTQLYIYVLSFILLAMFWRVNHQQFYLIKKSDNQLIWINILWLMFVALVPFSASLVGDYGEIQIPNIFFHLNMFFIGVFFYLNWYYAARKNFLDEQVDSAWIGMTKRINLALPLVSLLAIFLTYLSFFIPYNPSWSSLAYFLISFSKKVLKNV